MSLWLKLRRKREIEMVHGRLVWPSPPDGTLAISAPPLTYMLDGTD
jgi:hypothetical protein